MSLESRKGAACRIKSKLYKECEAWVDTAKKITKCKVPVIIKTDEGLKATRVDKESVDEPYDAPTSYEEAALQQKPEMD